MQNISQQTIKKILIIIGICLGLLFIGAIIITAITAPKTASISNIDSFLKGYKNDADTYIIIRRELYNTISKNTSEDPSKLTDITIRDESFSQEKDGSIYTTSFIVDIPSIKQSYKVSYEWDEKDKSGKNLDEWRNSVSCIIDQKDVIYPEFNCTDDFISNLGTNDPIARILPRIDVGKYKISADIADGKVKEINIDIYACTSNTADKYKELADNWLASRNIDLSNYIINTNYCVTN